MDVENCQDSHKPVEISDLRLLMIQGRGGIPRGGPTQPGKLADGPLRASKGPISLSAGLD